jgi:glycosyltransferase involved in cell wall biosynthesis
MKNNIHSQKMQENKTVIILRTESFKHDVRVPKIKNSLEKSGYIVKIINWDRDYSEKNSVEDNQIQMYLQAPKGPKILLYLPFWWLFVIYYLFKQKWDIIHVVNYDSIIPALIVAKIRKKPVIYEILDILEFHMEMPFSARKLCLFIDKIFMKASKGVIVVDDMQIVGLGGIPNPNIVTIYDSPPVTFYPNPTNNVKNDGTFLIFIAGVLYKDRKLNLDKLFEAVKQIDNVKIIIAGDGDLIEDIIKWSICYPEKIEYIGKIPYSDVLNWGSKVNLFIVLRDTINLANKFTCGSTIFNSMICGKPLLVNKGSSTSEIVSKEKIGFVVDANNIDEIKNAISELKNNSSLYHQFSVNAHNAYKFKYGWEIMENRLINFYDALINLKKM